MSIEIPAAGIDQCLQCIRTPAICLQRQRLSPGTAIAAPTARGKPRPIEPPVSVSQSWRAAPTAHPAVTVRRAGGHAVEQAKH